MRLKIAFVLSALLLFGCTKLYKPTSDLETEQYHKADRNLFPAEVVNDISSYWDSTIAWPGIIRDFEITEKDSKFMVEMHIEHRYYDWLMDFGAQEEKFFISEKGEGDFRIKWGFPESVKREAIEKHTHKNDMVIVYGKPMKLAGDTVLVGATCIRTIPQKWYATKAWLVGR